MTNVLRNILAFTLVVSSVSFSALAKPAPKGKPAAVAKDPATEKKEDAKKINPALQLILNQIVSARMTAGVKFAVKERVVDGKKVTTYDIQKLNITAVVPFQEGFKYEFTPDKKSDNPIKDFIPHILFKSKDVTMVVKADIKEKGTLSIKFCDSISVKAGYCDPTADKKMLEGLLKATSFNEMFRLQFKEIIITFDKNIGGSKFSFSGTCEAYKSGIDSKVNPEMQKVECEFGGDFDSALQAKDYRFTFL